MSAVRNAAPLSFREKVGYGLGDMASNFYMGFFGLFLLYYYTDVFGISPAAAATMLLVTKVVDAISDPAMGLIADRTHSRWGKYRPYLLWVAVPYAGLGYLLFLGPELSSTGKLIYAYVTYTLIMLAYTAINVPYSALLAVISPVAEERTKATQFRFVFASLGTLCVGAFATPLVEMLGNGDELLGFRLTIVLFAILSVVIFWITFASTRERVQLPRHDSSIGEDFSALLKNASWVVLVLTGILIVVGLVARFASIVYYVKYYLGDSGQLVFLIFDKTAVLTSCGLLGQLIGALITPRLTLRFEKHRLIFAMSIIHAFLLGLCYLVPPEAFWLITLVHSAGILTFGVTITLLFSMYTDCAEYGEWLTGKNTAGLTVSASMFSLKFGSAVGGALPGFMLAWFGFTANAAQSEQAMTGIRLMFNVVPAIYFLAGGALMMFYQIDRATLHRVERELYTRREKAVA
ncbi:MFS transporter [Congregibacter litoralis]|uniref:Sugar (Glycoside-Pentoside-Hexuronide) transporter n=1 Tax=Congregibacter litoralis KT71 TaxID=314285 RepID=A4AAW4_9GAMM|nr:MFS transporter [Congregibacter litoralis]EAQ96836.2 sugar (Glycoside-Pentoside-Hexuronide) transporter [Congregibacter litoralis KT71]